jgi:uncharacterized protein (TIRG00374 family)
MSGLARSALWALALLVAVVAVASIVADVRDLGGRLYQVAPAGVVAALGLAFLNYVIRFWRWQLYLRRSRIDAPVGVSALTFVAGFSMAVTPGKVGELLKAVLLRDAVGAPASPTAGVVFAERVTDLVALVLLALGGAWAYGIARELVVGGVIFTLAVLVAISMRRVATFIHDTLEKFAPLRRFVPRLREIDATIADLARPWPLAWATALSLVAWLAECVGFAIVVKSFPGADVSWGVATAIYAATTVAGALSFLPGGLGVTEAGMTLLLMRSAQGVDQPTAVAATIVTRLCTLWFAVVLGFAALLVLRRRRAAGKVPPA